MNSKYLTLKMIVYLVLLLLAESFIASSNVFAQSKDVKALTPNYDIYIGRVSLQKAQTRAFRRFSKTEAARLLEPFLKMVKTEYGGDITDFQFRYHLGRRAFVIRGKHSAGVITAYAYEDKEFDFSEWANIPSALTGPFIALPKQDVNRLSDEHQKHFEALFGPKVMLEDMQLEVIGSPLIVIAGAMRWKPPKTHLHSIIIVKIPD